MPKAILSYKFICDDYTEGLYYRKGWELGHMRILDKIPPPFADLDEGWYIDKDKRIAYFYTKEIEDKNELTKYARSIQPTTFLIDCFVRYEFAITDYNTESECFDGLVDDTINNEKIGLLSKCLCKESETENCIDEINKVFISRLDTCVKTKNDNVSLIKIINGPDPI